VNDPIPLRSKFPVAVHFEYDIQQAVVIRGSSIEATVTGLCKDTHGLQYRVAYWYNGMRFDCWVFGWEISPKAST
jgi:hypothetical protein